MRENLRVPERGGAGVKTSWQCDSALRMAARHTGVPVELIRTKNRSREYVQARAAVAEILHREGWSLSRIGRALGGRHHTTVMNLLKQKPYRKPVGKAVALPDESGIWAI